MSLIRRLATLGLLVAGVIGAADPAAAQVTTSSMSGTVRKPDGSPVAGAVVGAIHTPSGSSYSAQTRADGRFNMPGMRVGGPYTVSARAIGYQPQSQPGIMLELGVAADIAFVLNQTAVNLKAVAVTAEAGTFSSERTGAATRIGREAIAAFPTIGRTLTEFTRLTPQSTSGGSFAGLDNRYNNIQIDGSTFNNSFGLAGQPGGRTGVSPIPLEAVDQIQVSIAPFDVRQGNFVGAGVNAVTRSGGNDFTGAVYYNARNQDYVGTMASGVAFNPGTFTFAQTGVRVDGPLIKNKLFFMVSYESDKLSAPGTTFMPNAGGQTVGGNTTRVLKSDLDSVSSYLKNKFNYVTGAYQGYNLDTPSDRLLLKFDWNVNEKNKLSFRYSKLNSSSDQLVSNSNSLGFGSRRTNLNSMSFANSGYAILENIDSYVGEWNTQFGSNMSNNLIVGYTSNDESRKYASASGTVDFPLVDILQGGVTYMNFGFEPFTPNNELRYKTFQIQDNFTIYAGKHDLTFGGTFEKYNSENVFYPGSQSAYVYNSLADFFTDANDYLLNPARVVSPITLNTFQVRYNNIPGQVKPVQPLEVLAFGAYAQDNWHVNDNLNITYGLRMDLPTFSNTTFKNAQADTLVFRDRTGQAAKYSTSTLPSATPLWSPRIGFSWFVSDDHVTRVRGGTGVFTGKPAYVWISNQIGQNGVITGFSQVNNTTTRPFSPAINKYYPATVTGAPAASYELDFTDPNFKFPQLWRSTLAIDRKLPGGFIATVEGIYSKDVNGMYYYNANLPNSTTNFTGVDQRPRWGGTAGPNRIYPFVTAAYVLSNQSDGTAYSLSASLEKSFTNGFFAKVAYNYGVARNTTDPGSIAGGTWTGTTQSGNPNNVGVGYSGFSPGHRYFIALSYRKEYFNFGATTISVFGEGVTQGNTDYTFSGDINGDGGTSNDLLYIPKNTAEMNFKQQVIGSGASAVTFTPAQQSAAWDAYINQDDYLSSHRGQYMERGGLFLPMLFRADLSLVQDFWFQSAGKRNNLQVRVDILNVGNLLNNSWGTGQRLVTNTPLISQGVDVTGAATYYLRAINNQLVTTTLQNTAGLGDVYRFQLGVRYSFY